MHQPSFLLLLTGSLCHINIHVFTKRNITMMIISTVMTKTHMIRAVLQAISLNWIIMFIMLIIIVHCVLFATTTKRKNLIMRWLKNTWDYWQLQYNQQIQGRVAVLPLTGKYCMEKRGVAASELSTVQKKPGYHADFVIWGLEPYVFTKMQRHVVLQNTDLRGLEPYSFTKVQRIIRVCLYVFHVLEPYTIAKAQRLQTFTRNIKNGLRPYIFFGGKK